MHNITVDNGFNFNNLVICQVFYDGAGIIAPSAHFFNMTPQELGTPYIVAVWRLKLKTAPVPLHNITIDIITEN